MLRERERERDNEQRFYSHITLKKFYRIRGYIDLGKFVVANIDIIYLLIPSSIKRGGDGGKVDGLLFQSAVSITLLEHIKIWCNIQIIIYRLLI